MPDDERQHLAQQQAALVQSLVARTPPPPDFDPDQLNTVADSLHRKRTRGIEKSAPWLPALLKDRYTSMLETYLKQNPAPPAAGHGADVQNFVSFLLRSKELSLRQRLLVFRYKLRSFVRKR